MGLDTLGREMLAAGLGCAIADGALNGLEVTKVKMQLDVSQCYPKSTVGTIRQCVAEDGAVSGLMLPGLSATFLRAMTYVAFRVGTYPTVRDAVCGGDGGATLANRVLAGAITGGVGSMIFCPIDVVRVRMQADAPGCHARTFGSNGVLKTGLRAGQPVRYPTTLGAFGRIVSTEGLGGLYRGSGATVARATMLSGSQLGSYDYLKSSAKELLGLREGPVLHLSCSLLSGLIAQTVIQPVDTARSHIMASRTSTVAMVRANGLAWFYRGFSAACLRQGPIMVMQMPLTEQIRLLMGVGAF